MNIVDAKFFRILRHGGISKEVTQELVDRTPMLTSPNGHRWQAHIANDGTVTWTDLDA